MKHVSSIILAVLLLASGCICGGGETSTEDTGTADSGVVKQTPTTVAAAGGGAVKPTPTQPPATVAAAGGGVLSNLQNLLSGAGMRCTYTNKGMTVVSYMKGEKNVRSEYTADGKNMISILNGDTVYFGGKDESTWLTMKVEENAGEAGTPQQGGQGVDYAKMKEEIDRWECQPTTVNDGMFRPPAGVTLIDMNDPSAMMQNAEALSKMYGGG